MAAKVETEVRQRDEVNYLSGEQRYSIGISCSPLEKLVLLLTHVDAHAERHEPAAVDQGKSHILVLRPETRADSRNHGLQDPYVYAVFLAPILAVMIAVLLWITGS